MPSKSGSRRRLVRLLWIASASAMILAAGCGGKKSISPRIVDSRHPDPPYKWYRDNRPPKDKQNLYAIGRVDYAVRKEDAFSDAYNNGLTEIRRMITSKVDYTFKRARAETGIALSPEQAGRIAKEAVIVISEGVLNGVEVVESQLVYWHSSEDPTIQYIEVASLLGVSREEVRRAARAEWKQQIRKAREKNDTEAERFLNKVEQHFMEEE